MQRLRIARPPLRIEGQVPGRVILAIGASTATRTSTLRFTIARRNGQPAAGVRLGWTFALADDARELDLGEGRLLNPPLLARDLETAVNGYIDTLGLPQTADLGRNRARSCRQIGRLLDALAATSDPALRRTLQRQKRRDALGWLFKDNYRLRTDSPDTADWESEADYAEYGY
ncbi:MAG: hypothetical protein J0M19_04405 [Sphingomonadales bacterium]|nr:hypothetical protein [Sphingomonadales bacterium]